MWNKKYRKWFSIQLLKVFQNPLITYTQESLNSSSSSSSLSLSLHLPFIGLSAEHVLHLSSFNSHNLCGISHFPFYKWRQRSREKVSNLPKCHCWKNRRVKIQTEVCRISGLSHHVVAIEGTFYGTPLQIFLIVYVFCLFVS